MISGLRASTYEDKLSELEMTTLEERRHQTDMLQMWKIMHGQDVVTDIFQRISEGERTTRAAADPLNVRQPFARLEVRKNFFTVRVPPLWNAVPTEIKNARSKETFKRMYRDHRRNALNDAQG